MQNETQNPGYLAHLEWEKNRGNENECDAESRLVDAVRETGQAVRTWWEGWLNRSDVWRDEIGHKG